MNSQPCQPLRLAFALLAFCLLSLPSLTAGTSPSGHWVGTWGTSPMAEDASQIPVKLRSGTLRQIVHVSLGGKGVRLRLSNAFGTTPLVLKGVHLALATQAGAIEATTDTPVLFGGRPTVSVPAGATFVSDPICFTLPDQADLAISILFDQLPNTVAGHGGSRTNSYFMEGDQLSAPALPSATKLVHWYFIKGLDVHPQAPEASTLILLGDSITDGYGTTTDTNQRWPDELVRRLQKQKDIPPLGTINVSIGGNRVLRDGNGPSALSRLERDVLSQPGARWLVVFIGINDIGTRLSARKNGDPFASAEDLIVAYEQILSRARDAGLKVFGATITPYEGNENYWCEDGESDRQKINTWIRSSGRFDSVIDFDLAVRDPAKPTRLAPQFDCGDHLHPSIAGYTRLAEAIDLTLFKK